MVPWVVEQRMVEDMVEDVDDASTYDNRFHEEKINVRIQRSSKVYTLTYH